MSELKPPNSYEGLPNPKVYDSVIAGLKLLFSSSRISVSGEENIPGGPVIFATTHRGYGDIPILGVCAPDRRIRFVAKKELFSVPLLRTLMINTGAIPVDRKNPGQDTFHGIISGLKSQQDPNTFIAPEGGIKTGDEVGKIQPGLGFIACFTNASIVPTGIYGTEKLPYWINPGDAHIHFGDSFETKPICEYDPALDLSMRHSNKLFTDGIGHIREISSQVHEGMQNAFEIARLENAHRSSPNYFVMSLTGSRPVLS